MKTRLTGLMLRLRESANGKGLLLDSYLAQAKPIASDRSLGAIYRKIQGPMPLDVQAYLRQTYNLEPLMSDEQVYLLGFKGAIVEWRGVDFVYVEYHDNVERLDLEWSRIERRAELERSHYRTPVEQPSEATDVTASDSP